MGTDRRRRLRRDHRGGQAGGDTEGPEGDRRLSGPGGRRVLTLEAVDVYYGAIHALKSVSLQVDKGEIATMIGANGAGKSTTIRTVSGLVRPRSGRVVFDGEEIT